jgi:hypothetical protein
LNIYEIENVSSEKRISGQFRDNSRSQIRDAKSRGELLDKIRKVNRIQNRDDENFINPRFPYGLGKGASQDISYNNEPTNHSTF